MLIPLLHMKCSGFDCRLYPVICVLVKEIAEHLFEFYTSDFIDFIFNCIDKTLEGKSINDQPDQVEFF